MTEELCKELVGGGNYRWTTYRPCGRKAKEDGLCGIHLAAKRRVANNEQARIDKRDTSENLRKEVDKFLTEHGIDGRADYRWSSDTYSGKAVVSLDELRRLIEAAK